MDIARLYQEALTGALKLVGADGGELAMLDPVRKGMVVRARIRGGHPGTSGSGSAFGAPARSSQPLGYSSARYDPSRAPAPQPATSVPEIGEQPTVLLAAVPTARVYRLDEGLVGTVWRRADVTVLRGEDFRALAHGTGAPGTEALWHAGVPIYRPGTLDVIPPIGGTSDLIGVLTVYSDAARGFSGRDIEALRMHADRVSRDLRIAELARQSQSQRELLEVLRSGTQDLPALYQRIRDLVRHLVDAPSFALVLYYPGDEVALEVAERDGTPVPSMRRRAATLPAWWNAVRQGQMVRNASAEERAAHPEFSQLGWGGDTPIASLLAAPLTTGSSFLGALVAASPRAEAYGPEQTRLFEAVARAGAIVLENGRLADEMRHAAGRNLQKAHQMAVLNNAALTINASLDLDETVQALADQASHLTSAEVCSVFLLNEERSHLVSSASSRPQAPQAEQPPRSRVPLDWRDLGQILQSGQFTVMDHLDQDWQDDSSVGLLLKQYQVYNGLLLPISHRTASTTNRGSDGRTDAAPQDQEELLGILFVFTPGKRHHFSPTETGLLQGLASQAGAAISNARLYQNLKEAKERLEELDRLKNNFILTISHEFRTPLTTINGYISLIKRHGQKLEPEKLGQFGTEIQLATDKLAGMIGMLADASMLDERELDVHIEPVNLRAMAQRAVAGLTEDLKGRISLDIPPDAWVLADAERLPMVISNLLTNAGKYAPGSPYRLAVRRERGEQLQQQGHLLGRKESDGKDARNNEAVLRAASAHKHWLVAHVIDSGPGVAPEDMERIFQRFVRSSQSLTTPVRGTGLGLWICREYIEAMGGNIWVESTTGRGSDFQFCLPETVAKPTPQ
ncbi:MAG: GAF domain-containing protein [Nitrososphaerota archaeon]